MAKTYNMGDELKTLGAVVTAKPTPRTTKYQKYDGFVTANTSTQNKYPYQSVLPQKVQKQVDMYHATRGKVK